MKQMIKPSLPGMLPGDLAGRDRQALEGELYALLAERAERYTMGDSSSLRTESAEALLRGILYCVSLACRQQTGTQGSVPVKALFEQGRMEAERMARRGRLLLKQAEAFPPPVTNEAYRETLSYLPGFFKRYDPAFLSAEIPCDIDYPLCHPIMDSVLGVEYMNGYLRRVITENGFLRRFSRERLTALYEHCFDDYDGLLVNLYAPAAEAAVGCALIGRSVAELTASKAERTAVCDRITAMDLEAGETLLAEAAETVCREMAVTGEAERDYVRRAASDLLPRIRACAAAMSGEGVLPTA